jgi:hypothetical protein
MYQEREKYELVQNAVISRVAGTTYQKPNLKILYQHHKRKKPIILELIPEPECKQDPNASKVCGSGLQVGYVPWDSKHILRHFLPKLQQSVHTVQLESLGPTYCSFRVHDEQAYQSWIQEEKRKKQAIEDQKREKRRLQRKVSDERRKIKRMGETEQEKKERELKNELKRAERKAEELELKEIVKKSWEQFEELTNVGFCVTPHTHT